VRQVGEVWEVGERECEVQGADLRVAGEAGEVAEGGWSVQGVGVGCVEEGEGFGGAVAC